MDGTPNMADLFGRMADMQKRMADTQSKLAEERVTEAQLEERQPALADIVGRLVQAVRQALPAGVEGRRAVHHGVHVAEGLLDVPRVPELALPDLEPVEPKDTSE